MTAIGKVLGLLCLVSTVALAQEKPASEVMNPLQHFVGSWEVTAKNADGTTDQGELKSQLVLNGHVLQQNAKFVEGGGRLSLFSYDRTRQKFVLRSFWSDGAFWQFVGEASPDGKTATMLLENYENPPEPLPEELRVKLTVEILNDNEYVMNVEIAADGTTFTPFSETHYKRKPQE